MSESGWMPEGQARPRSAVSSAVTVDLFIFTNDIMARAAQDLVIFMSFFQTLSRPVGSPPRGQPAPWAGMGLASGPWHGN